MRIINKNNDDKNNFIIILFNRDYGIIVSIGISVYDYGNKTLFEQVLVSFY